MHKILVIGSTNTDMVILTERFPEPGETIVGGKFLINPGGKGANQAVAAARLGAALTFITCMGNDAFGATSRQGFIQEGIDTSFIITDPLQASGTALITVNEAGENTIVVAPGANAQLLPEKLKGMEFLFGTHEYLLMQLEIPIETVSYAAETANRQGKKVILNPAPAGVLPDELLQMLYLITPNETEAEILTGIKVKDEHSAEQAAAALKATGVQHVIITLGSKGAWVSAGRHRCLVPAPIVKAVDTTAAGDVFNGALAHALSLNQEWLTAVGYACKAAAISVTRIGAQSSAPTFQELN
ncbi:ribokinase [Pedobacter heparinus]|uniref:Ribokinase n=1 Tax=Pedobacter heparinus (strain ATCC 13125 / DSM 2366 / CIP 104194 / JCM 7457 / NBRC 12017 / NCIMB 9290 / NRRL B-14731 / HIM 762-3) TaxID=485917 RepID=C6XSW6_PEDHD|nr:ribokinase [Pedobacter heparinus]ACU03527.1 ribokinase [Pedobacter heparinus DSM 2366]